MHLVHFIYVSYIIVYVSYMARIGTYIMCSVPYLYGSYTTVYVSYMNV